MSAQDICETTIILSERMPVLYFFYSCLPQFSPSPRVRNLQTLESIMSSLFFCCSRLLPFSTQRRSHTTNEGYQNNDAGFTQRYRGCNSARRSMQFGLISAPNKEAEAVHPESDPNTSHVMYSCIIDINWSTMNACNKMPQLAQFAHQRLKLWREVVRVFVHV